MSIYDNIKTAKDLILEVKMHGLSTNTEDICRAQDIFGHSTIEELEALATDTGRCDNDGNPSQFGNWSSAGKDGTQKIFYQIIFTIWNWQDATKYYNEHSNPLYMEGRDAVKENSKLKKEIEQQREQIERLKHEIEELKKTISKLQSKNGESANEVEALENEIIKLKAKLYDLTSNG